MTDLTLVELFAGIGGFSCGFGRAGVATVAAVEIDAKAQSVLRRNFPFTPVFDDVAAVTGEDITTCGFSPDRGVLTAGWPCQDISVAGRGKGLSGERSGLFYEVIRLLDELRPRWFVLENVPRLLSLNGGRDMGAVVGALAECGYGIAYRVLDASGFGTAQRRRRIFFVGYLGDNGNRPAQVLFDREGLCVHSAPAGATQPQRRRTVKGSLDASGRVDPVAALTAQGVGTCGADDNQAQAGHLLAGTDGVRRLMPVECERLQGFPDGWTDVATDSARYRMLGNAVAVPVVEWIATRLVEVDERVESGQCRESDSQSS